MLKDVRKLLGVINYFEWGFDIRQAPNGKVMMLIILHNEVFDLHVEENASDEERKQIENVVEYICKDVGMEVSDIPDVASDVYVEFVDMAIKSKFTLSVLTADDYDYEIARPARARNRHVIEFDEQVIMITIGNEGYIFGITSEDMMIELIDKVK
jgi:hypothetical protein